MKILNLDDEDFKDDELCSGIEELKARLLDIAMQDELVTVVLDGTVRCVLAPMSRVEMVIK